MQDAGGNDEPTIMTAFRRAPLVLRIAWLCYVALLIAAVATAFANSTSPVLNPLLGAFGISAVLVGALILADYRGSAAAMLLMSSAVVRSRGHGRTPTLARQQIVALLLVIIGGAFAIVGFVTGVHR